MENISSKFNDLWTIRKQKGELNKSIILNKGIIKLHD